MQKVYTKIESIVGNVVTVRASGVRSGDLALVGESYASVIKLSGDLVSLQVFAGTQGVSTTDTVRFLGRPMMVSFSDDLLGRVFDGAGVPRDNGPALTENMIPIGGPSVNPAKRIVPKRMIRTGIPMIIVNCKMDDMNGALCYVGCDDLTAGELLMEYAAGLLGGKGTIGILRGPDGLDAAIKRTTGIDNKLKENPDISVYSSQAANWKTAEAMSIVENWLQSTSLDAVVCENDEMAIGAVEAIKGHGKSLDDVLVFGIDGIPSAYQSIANGEMKATLLQDAKAIAAKTVEVMQLYFETGSVESEYIIPWVVVDSKNINEYYKAG